MTQWKLNLSEQVCLHFEAEINKDLQGRKSLLRDKKEKKKKTGEKRAETLGPFFVLPFLKQFVLHIEMKKRFHFRGRDLSSSRIEKKLLFYLFNGFALFFPLRLQKEKTFSFA